MRQYINMMNFILLSGALIILEASSDETVTIAKFSNNAVDDCDIVSDHAVGVSHAESSLQMHMFLVSNNLEQYEDRLNKEGFKTMTDFEGMTDNRLERLCAKIGIEAIGVQNRLIREVKKHLRKSMIVITEQEEKTFDELEKSIEQLTKQKNFFEFQIIELYNLKTEYQNIVVNHFQNLRSEINVGEKNLMDNVHRIFIDQLSMLLRCIDTNQNETLLLSQVKQIPSQSDLRSFC